MSSQYDDDDLAALTFSSATTGEDSDYQPDDFDFTYTEIDTEENLDDLNYEFLSPDDPPSDDGDELLALQVKTESVEESREIGAEGVCLATNASSSITVHAYMDGRIERVEVSTAITSMRESELAREVLRTADLAKERALAAQLEFLANDDFLTEAVQEMGISSKGFLRDFIKETMDLPTSEQVNAKEVETFSARYHDS